MRHAACALHPPAAFRVSHAAQNSLTSPLHSTRSALWLRPRLSLRLQLRLILVGLGGLVIETIRAPDISAGFGLMSIMTQRMLYQQFGAMVLPVAVLVLLATAKSLSVQLSRPLPKVFPRLMWTLIAINQILVLPTLVGVDTYTAIRRLRSDDTGWRVTDPCAAGSAVRSF